jgi:NAD(P)H-flavin reductase
MAQHKYSVGQSVKFTPDRSAGTSARGAYTVVKRLPESEGILQYHVRAKVDGRERVVREDQLDR